MSAPKRQYDDQPIRQTWGILHSLQTNVQNIVSDLNMGRQLDTMCHRSILKMALQYMDSEMQIAKDNLKTAMEEEANKKLNEEAKAL